MSIFRGAPCFFREILQSLTQRPPEGWVSGVYRGQEGRCLCGGLALLLREPNLPAAMSVASLEAFCARIAADDDLRNKVHAAAGVDDIVAIAAAHGHDVDKTVLLREHAKAVSSASDHALSGINSWADALMHCFGAEKVETEV